MTDKVTLKYSLGRFRNCMPALQILKRTRLSMGLAYGINRVIDGFLNLLKPTDEGIKDIARKYGAKFSQKDTSFQIPTKNRDAFNIEVEEFLETEEELEVRPIVLPPECDMDNAGEVLTILEDFVSVRGMDAPEPRKPNPPGADGKPMSDGEWAQKVADETKLKVVDHD